MACSGQNRKKRLISTIYLWDVPQVRYMWYKELGRVVVAMFKNAIKALHRDRARYPQNQRLVVRRKSPTLHGHQKVGEIVKDKNNKIHRVVNHYLKDKF